MSFYVVKASFDEEACVWYVDHTDVPGLATEAPSVEELRRKIEVMTPELLEAKGVETGPTPIVALWLTARCGRDIPQTPS